MARKKATTKKHLIKEMAEETGETQKKIEKIVDLLFEKMSECLSEGDRVRIHNFGTFRTQARDSYTGRNPATGKSMTVEAKRVVRFAPSEILKNSL